jgi:hypothetical protein
MTVVVRVPGYKSIPGATSFFCEVGLEQGPLSLVSAIKELLGRKSSCFGLEIREYGRRDPSRWPRGTVYPQKLALTSPTSGGRSVGIVCLRTQAMEFFISMNKRTGIIKWAYALRVAWLWACTALLDSNKHVLRMLYASYTVLQWGFIKKTSEKCYVRNNILA